MAKDRKEKQCQSFIKQKIAPHIPAFTRFTVCIETIK